MRNVQKHLRCYFPLRSICYLCIYVCIIIHEFMFIYVIICIFLFIYDYQFQALSQWGLMYRVYVYILLQTIRNWLLYFSDRVLSENSTRLFSAVFNVSFHNRNNPAFLITLALGIAMANTYMNRREGTYKHRSCYLYHLHLFDNLPSSLLILSFTYLMSNSSYF